MDTQSPTGAIAYDIAMGRWSRIAAQAFVDWLSVPPLRRWLDVGCGTGALTTAILAAASPREVWGIDPSEEYIAYARETVSRGPCNFLVADAQALPKPLAAFDAAVSGLALNQFPQPSAALAEMIRVIRPGGVVGAYVWDFAGEMQLLRYLWDVAAELDPRARELDPGTGFPLCHPDRLRELFEGAGLRAVRIRPLVIQTDFCDFDDYWSPMLSGHGRAGGYVMSLDERLRSALRERIRAALPTSTDGSIHLRARAWAVRGRKAGREPGESV